MTTGRGHGSGRARLSSAIALIVIAGCTAPAAPATTAQTPSTSEIGPIAPAETASQAPSMTIEPSPSLVAAASPTAETTPTPSAPPTPPPTATPKPQPTLDWEGSPIGMGVSPDPTSLGKTVRVEVVVAIGPTCVLKVKYPSGSNASLPKPTRPDARHWVWKWTIPQSAGPGTAKVTATCTYAGVARRGTGTFTISGWSISATFPATLAHDVSALYGQVAIVGVWQRSITSPDRINCVITLVTNAGTKMAGENVFWYSGGQGPFDLSLPVGPLGPDAIGPASWTLACTNFTPDPQETRKDNGTIEIT